MNDKLLDKIQDMAISTLFLMNIVSTRTTNKHLDYDAARIQHLAKLHCEDEEELYNYYIMITNDYNIQYMRRLNGWKK